MPVDIHLKQKLEELDEIYGGDEMFRIFGPSSLTWSTIDSSRAYMWNQHIKQSLTLLNPDVPHLQTGFENSVGKYNRSYKKMEGTWEVKQIIPKFNFPEEMLTTPNINRIQIYTLVLYNKKTDTYDIIEKPVAENLTEKFGYVYDTTFMDTLRVGDKITDEIIYKSTAYDDHMNYRYGKNARVFYSTSTDTIEDAIVIRRGWAETVKSVEIDNVQVPINDNDVLLNLYGDDYNYKPFPEIGENVKDSLVCATRRINKSHLLYDFQKEHMRELMDTDTDYYTSKESVIYDINVYYNGDDEFPSNLFNQQLKRYYDDNCKYARNILEACNIIKNSGSNYTENVSYFRSRYLRYNDKDYKWKNKDKAFGHVILEFKVKSIVGLDLGSKITGRYGNKGVISRIMDDSKNIEESIIDLVDDGTLTDEDRRILKSRISIVDDERMQYYIQDGKRVYADIQLNASGSVRRLNPGQLVEVEANFIAEQIQFKIKNAKTLEEKEEIFFKFLECVNADQCTFFKNIYDSYEETKMINGVTVRFMSPSYKRAFIEDVEKNGFYIVRPPHKPLLFDDIIRLYDTFPDVRPVDIYVDLFGTQQRKTMRRGVIGYQYILVLKQNSNKNFSARSTFRVNRSNLPAKDIAKKTNRSSYARTPVRLSEIYNLLASVSGTDLAEYNIFMRSSALGRKSLDRIISADSNPLKIQKLKVKETFTNANADILSAKLKTMGLRLYFSPIAEGRTTIHDDTQVCALHFGDYVVYDYPRNRQMYQELFTLFKNKLRTFMTIESYRGEKHDICWDDIFNDDELNKKYELTDEIKNQLKAITKGHASSLIENINTLSTRKAVSSDTSNSAPRKRGRKSKAEKEELLRQQREIEREALSKNYDDSEEEVELEDEEYIEDSDTIDDENDILEDN